jgi:hypothetical protein
MSHQDRKSTATILMGTTSLERRQLLIAPVLAALVNPADASAVDPRETFVVQPKEIQFKPWQGLPPASGEMAALYGDLNQPGPYLAMMKWNPGWFSAPHNYRTDRIVWWCQGHGT